MIKYLYDFIAQGGVYMSKGLRLLSMPMRATLPLVILLSCLLFLAGCTQKQTKDDITASENTLVSDTTTTTAESEETETAVDDSQATPQVSETSMGEETLSTIEMYSSYAYMVSFDASTGLAEFDYFTMLTGQEAIDFLVSNKGYSYEDAKAEVDAFCDGEFVMKNINTQLRTIDLRVTPILSLYATDGSQASTWPTPCAITYDDFVSLYEYDQTDSDGIDYTQGSLFYYITVVDGEVTQVAQTYWC